MRQAGLPRLVLTRLRTGWRPIAEATAVATVAWVISTRLVGHPQPFFAPAAGLIVVGQARGQRAPRALEVVLGVAGGILVADVVAEALGRDTTPTIFTVVVVTLVCAVAVGAGTIGLVQAAVSALYVAVVTPPIGSVVSGRFVDALVGGGVALAVSRLSRPVDPLGPLMRESREVFDEVAGVLRDAAGALDQASPDAAFAALERARRADELMERLSGAVAAAREELLLDVRRRQRLPRVRTVEAAIRHVDYVVRSTRVLARACVGLTRRPEPPPPPLVTALRLLATAVSGVQESLAAELAGDGAGAARQSAAVEDAALQAVRIAGGLLAHSASLSVVMIVGQIRMSSIDLLRAAGADEVASIDLVDEALGPAEALGSAGEVGPGG